MSSNNHFKPWSTQDDALILDDPRTSNVTLAAALSRSENAIRCRRAHLAVRMHIKNPELALDECCELLWADPKKAQDYLDELGSRDAALDRFLENRKRPRAEAVEDEDEEDEDQSHTKKTAQGEDTDTHESVAQVCKAIRDEDGQLSNLWAEHALVPTIIKYYPGFKAYAQAVRGL